MEETLCFYDWQFINNSQLSSYFSMSFQLLFEQVVAQCKASNAICLIYLLGCYYHTFFQHSFYNLMVLYHVIANCPIFHMALTVMFIDEAYKITGLQSGQENNNCFSDAWGGLW